MYKDDGTGQALLALRGGLRGRFRRSFVLADGVEVARARLSQGLLHIDLERAVPETVVRRIPIGTGGQER